jgi:hypothetical protein
LKSRPILFSGPMVRAILDGRKSQTRRAVKPTVKGCTVGAYSEFSKVTEVVNRDADGDIVDAPSIQCPYGAPGDELWVRETFASFDNVGQPMKPKDAAYVVMRDGTQVYRDGVIVPRLAEYAPGVSDHIKWRRSTFMPRWASRLTLVVKSVRVERLSLISGEDVVAEGFDLPHGVDESHVARDRGNVSTRLRFDYIAAFRTLNKLAADADPLVWVIEFERKQGGAA